MRYSLLSLTLLSLVVFPITFYATAGFAQTESSIPYAVLPVASDGEVIESVGGGATDAILPTVETIGGISYITGGVGEEELAYLKAQEQNFNVRVLIKAKSGDFISEIAVHITNSKKAEILRVESAGPYLYTKLPAGAYFIETKSVNGAVKTTKFTVPNKGNREVQIVYLDSEV